ncbi:methylmalonyl-CoA mutase family protein [Chelativorans sp. Marseille-P2723]|uniref:methylmalonyl-CoA mutase family protein n=1 Tax=Chelativorans sp. Marseille-P2723 TaxID=2709133 RepID=UPI00156DF892|nr:methylmalonyl-CoA mutase family protein [Chelativorans sp. Marseille-P2723]
MDRSVLTKADFATIGRRQWLELVARTLGSETGYESLIRHRDDGASIAPLYEPAEGPSPISRGKTKTPWKIVQRLDDPDPGRANEQARDDLENGATGLSFVFAGAPNAFGYGLPASREGLETVLNNIPLKNVHLRIDVHPQSRASIDWLAEILQEKRADPAEMTLSFGIDPASLFAGTGRLRMSIEALEASMPPSLAGFFAMSLPGILLEADGRVFHNAGATEAQELGIMLASAVAHLKMFEEARQPLIYAAPHIGFALAVDQNQFLSMAKIRALRKLWARVQEACGIAPAPANIHAETSYRMMTVRDPEANILRTTIAAFAAAAGGADSLSVLPHTIAHGLPNSFARRIARNEQLILARESRLDSVADTSSGSGGIEALTASLCEKAWDEFSRIEEEGGILRSLAAGHVQARIADARTHRLDALSRGACTIVGTTLYKQDKEPAVSTLEAERQIMPPDGAIACTPLPASRLDEGLGEHE